MPLVDYDEAPMNDDFRHMFLDMAEGFTQMNPIVHSEPKQPNPGAQAFYKMLEKSNEKLYDGENMISLLMAPTEILQIKTDTHV